MDEDIAEKKVAKLAEVSKIIQGPGLGTPRRSTDISLIYLFIYLGGLNRRTHAPTG